MTHVQARSTSPSGRDAGQGAQPGAGGATAYRAARLLTPDRMLSPGHITVRNGLIEAVEGHAPEDSSIRVVDLGAHDLLPGLVDLHSDCWHQRARPRATTTFSLADALVMVDTEVASWGVTTNYLCVAVQDDASKGRTLEGAREAVLTVSRLRPQLRVDHRVHLRVEATTERVDVADDLAAIDVVELLSYMDHTPGQGQFRNSEDAWRSYYASTGETDLDGLLARRRARQGNTDDVRDQVAAIASRRGLVLASHDDDSVERVAQAARLGAAVAEFPVTLQAAQAAAQRGLLTVMGAPNAVRGTSHLDGNLSAREALQAGALGALASDYHPPSLLGAVYALADSGTCDLPTALALVTSRPAAAAGLSDRGRLIPGARADFIAVTRRAGRPTVSASWVAGTPVIGPPHQGV